MREGVFQLKKKKKKKEKKKKKKKREKERELTEREGERRERERGREPKKIFFFLALHFFRLVLDDKAGRLALMTATGSGKNRGKCRRDEETTHFSFFLRCASQAKTIEGRQCPQTPTGASWATLPRRATPAWVAASPMPQLRDAGAAPAAAAASRGSQSGSSRWARARTTRTTLTPTRAPEQGVAAVAIGSAGASECTAARCSTPEGASLSGRTGKAAR